jgi:hypothetical protein
MAEQAAAAIWRAKLRQLGLQGFYAAFLNLQKWRKRRA